jgi:hypothetical protein
MYPTISHQLSIAKKSGDPGVIRKILLDIVATFQATLSGPLSYETFAEFIYDKDSLLKKNEDIFSQTKADIHLVTNGLLDQVLDIYGIKEHAYITDELGDALYDIHTRISKKRDATMEKAHFERVLETLRSAVEKKNVKELNSINF